MISKSLIIFILLINENICFESSDICLQTDLECQGISDPFNNYKNHCKKTNCTGDYSYKCDDENCAINEKSCEQFRKLKSNLMRLVLSPVMYNFEMRKYTNVFGAIKKCQIQEYKWDRKDICMRSENCVFKLALPYSYMINLKQRTICSCNKLYSYQCDSKYCAKHNKACDLFKLDSMKKKARFDKCGYQGKKRH